jgi:hypothetical protein
MTVALTSVLGATRATKVEFPSLGSLVLHAEPHIGDDWDELERKAAKCEVSLSGTINIFVDFYTPSAQLISNALMERKSDGIQMTRMMIDQKTRPQSQMARAMARAKASGEHVCILVECTYCIICSTTNFHLSTPGKDCFACYSMFQIYFPSFQVTFTPYPFSSDSRQIATPAIAAPGPKTGTATTCQARSAVNCLAFLANQKVASIDDANPNTASHFRKSRTLSSIVVVAGLRTGMDGRKRNWRATRSPIFGHMDARWVDDETMNRPTKSARTVLYPDSG